MFFASSFGATLLGVDDFSNVPLIFTVLALFLSFVVSLIYVFRSWFQARRRVKKNTITAVFRPPLDMNPLEVAFFFRKKVDDKVFAGLLVHMAQRGIVHFRKHKGQKIVLPGPRHIDGLSRYEKLILKTVAENRNVRAADLIEYHKTIFTQEKDAPTLTRQLVKDLQARNFYNGAIRRRFLLTTLRMSLDFVVIIVWVGLSSHVAYEALFGGAADSTLFESYGLSIAVYSAVVFVVFIALSVVIQLLQSRVTGRRWIVRRVARRFIRHIVSFRQYVVLAERGKLRFDDELLQKKSSLNTLPYAIALGEVDNWRDIVS